MPSIPDYDKPTAVYRAFDASGLLLYVGMTFHLKPRFWQHSRRSGWWAQKTGITSEWYPDRWAAEAVEAAAILSEHPRHNKGASSYDYPPDCAFFGVDLPVSAVPAPRHVADAFRVPEGVIALRHMYVRKEAGVAVGLSSAWTVPQAWNRRYLEAGRTGNRPATQDEATVLNVSSGDLLYVSARRLTRARRPWLVEDTTADPLVAQHVLGLLAIVAQSASDEAELRAPIRPASADPDFGLGIPGFAIRMRP